MQLALTARADLLTYARVFIRNQAIALQLRILHDAESGRVFEATALGAHRERSRLTTVLDLGVHCVFSLTIWANQLKIIAFTMTLVTTLKRLGVIA